MNPRLEHILNPLHIWCRLIDLGLRPDWAKRMGVWYENKIYKRIRRLKNERLD
jgi:hypothetical protein